MQLIPAIDLMNSKIVRLTQGEAKTAKIYDQFGGPVETALRWRDEGAGKLHIIDLDAAFGKGNNHQIITEIAKNISLCPFRLAAESAVLKLQRNSSTQASPKLCLAR